MAVKSPKAPPSTKPNPASEAEEPFSPFSVAGIRSGAAKFGIVKGFIIFAGLVMALGLVLTSLTPQLPGGNQGGGGPAPTTIVAKVGGQSINRGDFENAIGRQMQQNQMYGMPSGVTNLLQTEWGALQQLTDNAANIEAARAEGISVSEEEIDKKIDKELKDSLKPQSGQTEAAFRRQIEAQYGSLEEAKKKLAEGADRDNVRNSLLLEKLEKQVKDANKVTEDDFKRSVTKLKLWQIVIRPKYATSGKDFEQQQEKNKADAKAKASKIFEQLKATPTLAAFKAAAMKDSDDEPSKKKGGDLGWKLPNELYYVPDMGDTLSKFPNKLVPPLYDDNGAAYIMFIEDRKTELPKDFAKNKKKLIADYETQRDNDAWSKKQQEFKKAVTPDIYDPAMIGYQIQTTELMSATGDNQKQLRQDALNRYSTAVGTRQGMEAAALHYQMAQLYRDEGDKANASKELDLAVKADGSDPQLLVEYARALREEKKTKEAVAQLKAASKALDGHPAQPSMFGGGNPNDMIRQQIADEFGQNKEAGLAAAERKKIPPPSANPQGGMFGGNNNIRIGR